MGVIHVNTPWPFILRPNNFFKNNIQRRGSINPNPFPDDADCSSCVYFVPAAGDNEGYCCRGNPMQIYREGAEWKHMGRPVQPCSKE